MLNIYKTDEKNILQELSVAEKGCWIDLINPDDKEIEQVIALTGFPEDMLKAALDEEERARMESEDGNTLLIVDIPVMDETENSHWYSYSTMPLGIVKNEDYIVTVCIKETGVLRDFISSRVRGFFTYKRNRFLLQILYRNSTKFLQYLKQIDKANQRVQAELHKSQKNKELIQLLDLEKSLVYFSTSLKSNEIVIEKLLKSEWINKYEEDKDLLEDVNIEIKQAIEMCTIYRDILSGTMDAYASVISNNLNIVMKFLTSITLVMAIPTIVASLWGMNVRVPFEDSPFGFWFVLGLTIVCTILGVLILFRKKYRG